MKKLNIIIFLSGLLLFTSCLFEQKDFFDKTPAERMDAFLSDYQSLLESAENGWFLEYYPDNDVAYGGYVYSLTFYDGEVSALFQLANDVSVPMTSLYKMTPDDGPVLSFDTYNPYIHYFATPSGGAENYQGYRGDTEFKIMGRSDDETRIYLVGRKSGNPCTLVMNEDYENPAEYLEACNAIRDEINYSTITSIEFQVGDYVGEATTNGEALLNNFFYFEYSEGEDSEVIEGAFPFCTTPEGISLFEPIKIDGVEYDFFYYDDKKNRFISDDDYVSINMIYTPISQQLTESEWYITRSNLSASAASQFGVAETALENTGDQIEYLAIGTTLNNGKTFGLQFKCKKGAGTFALNSNVKDTDMIGFKYAMKGEGDQTKYLANMIKIIDFFGRSSEKTFKVQTDNFKNPTWIKITDNANSAFSIKLVKEKTVY